MAAKYNKKGDDKMTIRTVSISKELWEAAKAKAGMRPISAVIRRLLELFIKGDLDNYFK